MTISERFTEFTKPNYFSRVDADHLLELHIGLDDMCRKAIELRSSFVPKKIVGTSAIEVNQYKNDEYNTIRFSLCDEEISELFYKFCEDLIEQTRELSSERDGYNIICNRFFQWKKLFVPKRLGMLSEIEIMGLIGEILFFQELVSSIGVSAALSAWSGQELTHKDFSYEDSWYEVKTINRGKQTVKISSLEQLESEKDGTLVVYSIEKMSEAYNGITLNRIVLETLSTIVDDENRDAFLAKVALHGYEYNSYYDSFVYELSDSAKYIVNNSFPKLTRASVPIQIAKVAYEISLSDINGYKI